MNEQTMRTVVAGFPIANGWVSISSKTHKFEIEANGSRVVVRGEEDILKLRDQLNELYPQSKHS